MASTTTAVASVRLPLATMTQLNDTATARNATISDELRLAVAAHLAEKAAAPGVSVS